MNYFISTVISLRNEKENWVEEIIIEGVVEKEKKNTGEKREKKEEDIERGYIQGELIDRNPPLRKTKKKILNEPNSELPCFVKPTFPILKKNPKKEVKDG